MSYYWQLNESNGADMTGKFPQATIVVPLLGMMLVINELRNESI